MIQTSAARSDSEMRPDGDRIGEITGHDVVIATGGPTGLMLADGRLHVRTIEVFDQRGIAGRFVPYDGIILDMCDLPTRHGCFLGLGDTGIERILANRAGQVGVPIYCERELTGFAQETPARTSSCPTADSCERSILRARSLSPEPPEASNKWIGESL